MTPHHPLYRRENSSTQDPSLASGTHATVPPLVIAAFVTLSLSLVLLGVFAAIKMRRAWLASKRESSASSVPAISSPRPPAYEEEVSEKFSQVDLTTSHLTSHVVFPTRAVLAPSPDLERNSPTKNEFSH